MQTKARSFLRILIALALTLAGAKGAQALDPRGITPTNGCMVYTSTDVPHDIPDGSGIGSDAVPGPPVNSVLHIPNSMVIGSVQVLNLQATHPFAQDLEFHLVSPANTNVLLLQGKCGANDNFNLSLDDSAALTLESPNACDDGQAHQPQQPLSNFAGQNASGQWTLVVRDDAGGDVGTLETWSLQICPPPTPGCVTYTSTDVPHDIPDGSGIGNDAVPGAPVNSVLHIPDSLMVGSVKVVNLQATHPFAQDLEFHLRSPANTDVLLLQGKCGDNNDFNLSLDDSAALTLESPNACDDGQAHRPQQPLASFNGQNASGQWTLVVRDDAGGDVGTLDAWSLQICPPPTPGCTTYTSTDVPHDIPDGSGLGSDAVPGPPVNSVLHIPDSTLIGSVKVLNLQATHPFAQDLEFHLRSPANTDVLLLQGKCGDNNDFNLSLDDSAALTLESPNACDDGQAHQPQQPLSSFNGQNASGQWTLVVRDDAGGDVGTLTGWGLQICTAGGTPTPTSTPTPLPCSPDGGGDQFSGGSAAGGAFSGTIMVPPGLLITPAGCIATGGTCTITPSGGGFIVNWMATLAPFQTGGFEVHYVPADDVPAGTKLCTTGSIHGPDFTLPGGSCFVACGRSPGCVDYHANDLPKDLPGFGSPLTSTITVPAGAGTIGHLSVLSLSADTFDDHFYSFHLMSPSQTNVSLINQRCNGNDHFFLGLDDSAASDLTDSSSCSDGLSHKPEASLQAFNGQTAQGTWTLRVDASATDLPGQLTNWGLRICPSGMPTPTQTPTPQPCNAFPGQIVNDTFIYNNLGQVDQNSVVSTVMLPPQLSAVAGTCTSSTCTCDIMNASTVTCTSPVAAGHNHQFVFGIQIAANAPTNMPLCGTFTSVFDGGSDSHPFCLTACGNPTATPTRSATPTRTPTPTRTFTPTITPTPRECVSYGRSTTSPYTIFANSSNTGPIDAMATNIFPPQVPIVLGSCVTEAGTCTTVDTSTVKLSVTLAPGQSVSYRFDYDVPDNIPPGTQLCSDFITQFGDNPPEHDPFCSFTCSNNPTPTITMSPTRTFTPTVTPSGTRPPTSTPTRTPTPTLTFTATRTATSTATHTHNPKLTYTPTPTSTKTETPTETFTPTATLTPTPAAVGSTDTPTFSPTTEPTFTPTGSRSPTTTPTITPTSSPTRSWTATFTSTPSLTASRSPSATATATGSLPTPTATKTSRSKLTFTPTATEAATATPTATPTGATGGGCTTGTDCVSGNCVDGRCCSTASCPTGEFCNIPMREGLCSGPSGNGAPCSTGQQCNSGNCVDGFCCAAPSCPTGEFCNSGECQAPAGNGTPCDEGAQCSSGFCVDSFCCASATCPAGQFCTTGQCEGGAGQNGAPCSDSAQCLSTFCVDGFCCSTQVCPDGQFCNTGTCGGPSGNGTPCSSPEQCMSTFCVDRTCCATGTCPLGQLCNISGEGGMCTGPAALGNPCVDPAQCQSGRCTDGECCDVAVCTVGQACDVPEHEGHCNPVTTPTPGGCGSCVGDCNGNCVVTVDELILMVNIALDDNGTGRCVAGDASGDGHITINEIIAAVGNALTECPSAAAPTPTVSSGTDGAVPRRAAGTTVGLSQGLPALPLVLSSITQLAGGGGAGADGNGSAAAAQPCSGGGTRDFMCTQTIPTAAPRNYTLNFSGCVLNTAGSGTVTLDGTITGQSTETGPLAICSLPPLALSTLSLSNVQAVVKNAAAATTLSAQFNLTGSLTATPSLLSACKVAGLTMTLNGTMDVQAATLSETLMFQSTNIKLDVTQFSQSCVPVIYQMTLNGNASFDVAALGNALSGTFTNFVFGDDTTLGNDLITIDGQLSSTCLGTAVMFSTPVALSLTPGVVCPAGGAVLVTESAKTDRLTYTATGGINIDLGNNSTIDEMLAACLDSQLYQCP